MVTVPLFYLILVLFVYVVIPGALVLFAWASITTAKGIRAAKKIGLASEQHKRWANISTAFLTLTLFIGITVGTIMYIGLSKIPYGFPVLGYALMIGIFMIPNQAISMAFYAKLKTKEDLV
jgi:hypothetical protein